MIGIFDSGAGGLSVWSEIVKKAPGLGYVYVSDGVFCPYGPKSRDAITSRCNAIVSYLINRGADIIVVACNTATAAAISWLRAKYDMPFVGMEPAIKPAAINTKSGVVGVLATKGTLGGELYLNTSKQYAKDIKVIEQVGEGLVEIVEQGLENSAEAEQLIRKYVEPMIARGADNIVLGCTHYPFLTPVIERVAKGKVKIINPAPAVARRALELYGKAVESNATGAQETNPIREICTTGSSLTTIKKLSRQILEQLYSQNAIDESAFEALSKTKYHKIKL